MTLGQADGFLFVILRSLANEAGMNVIFDVTFHVIPVDFGNK